MKRVWEGVLVAEESDLGKPRIPDAMMENMYTVLVENIVWSKERHHVEEGELVLVDQGRGGEGARQEM